MMVKKNAHFFGSQAILVGGSMKPDEVGKVEKAFPIFLVSLHSYIDLWLTYTVSTYLYKKISKTAHCISKFSLKSEFL